MSILSYTYISKNSGRFIHIYIYNIHRSGADQSNIKPRVCVFLSIAADQCRRAKSRQSFVRRSDDAYQNMYLADRLVLATICLSHLFDRFFFWTEKIGILYCLGTSHPTPSITHTHRWRDGSFIMHIYIGR